ncbi:hypothetical protein MRB53_039114 [Persea americana]|nr:hypothetical protein MRB53_039114 [Persea americana]
MPILASTFEINRGQQVGLLRPDGGSSRRYSRHGSEDHDCELFTLMSIGLDLVFGQGFGEPVMIDTSDRRDRTQQIWRAQPYVAHLRLINGLLHRWKAEQTVLWQDWGIRYRAHLAGTRDSWSEILSLRGWCMSTL